MDFAYEAKKKIVEQGQSSVFENWAAHEGITMDDFLSGLKWLCEESESTGKLTRELGCANGRLWKLKRVYNKDGSFAGFYTLTNNEEWGYFAGMDRASISARDRI